jgi:sec-independent protein translocase protein TatB
MFDIFSWQHIVILLVVALVVVGPKDLPRFLNMAGKWAGKARAMANEFRKSFDEMARQTELDELRKEIEDLKKSNPLTDIADSVSDVHTAINNPVEAMVDGAAQTPAEATAPVEGNIEPRSGEFEVTDAAVSLPEPVREPAAAEKSAP